MHEQDSVNPETYSDLTYGPEYPGKTRAQRIPNTSQPPLLRRYKIPAQQWIQNAYMSTEPDSSKPGTHHYLTKQQLKQPVGKPPPMVRTQQDMSVTPKETVPLQPRLYNKLQAV